MKGISLRWLVFVGILAVMLGLFTPVVRDAGAQAQNVLKIGALVPLGVKEGVEIKKWHELFAKMIDQQGGWTVGGRNTGSSSLRTISDTWIRQRPWQQFKRPSIRTASNIS